MAPTAVHDVAVLPAVSGIPRVVLGKPPVRK
jgi:hypothetical protein